MLRLKFFDAMCALTVKTPNDNRAEGITLTKINKSICSVLLTANF